MDKNEMFAQKWLDKTLTLGEKCLELTVVFFALTLLFPFAIGALGILLWEGRKNEQD